MPACQNASMCTTHANMQACTHSLVPATRIGARTLISRTLKQQVYQAVQRAIAPSILGIELAPALQLRDPLMHASVCTSGQASGAGARACTRVCVCMHARACTRKCRQVGRRARDQVHGRTGGRPAGCARACQISLICAGEAFFRRSLGGG